MIGKFYTVKDLADMLSVPESWIYERTRKRLIPHTRAGKYIRFSEDDIREFIEKLKAESESN